MLMNVQELIEMIEAAREELAGEIRRGVPIEPGELKAEICGRRLIVR
jgi:hypothetical protein